MYYIIALLALCVLYAFVFYAMKHFKSRGLTNLIFVLLVFLFYINLSYTVYSEVGFYDWNFQNTLPVANVSPFMFSITPLVLVLSGRAKKFLLLLISLLSVGMFLSTVFSMTYNAVIDYKFHWHFMLDYVAHFAISLFGIYIVRSGQVDFTLRNCLASGSLILGSATLMLVLNIIFDTSFFGLNLNGKHNIYNNVIVEDSYLSALLYYCGLIFVLLLGSILCKKCKNYKID